MSLNEAIVEEAALSWLAELGYAIGTGPDIAPGEAAAERTSFADVILIGRMARSPVIVFASSTLLAPPRTTGSRSTSSP
jgi:hypothetical protein